MTSDIKGSMGRATRFAIGLLLYAVALPVHAATITVTNTNDSGPGSLRQALASASDGDTINFTATGTISLTSGELLANRSVTIFGPGAATLAVDGNATSRVFHIGPGKTVSISGLTIINGSAISQNGGGILNDHAILTMDSCVVQNSGSNLGGGVYNNVNQMNNLTVVGNPLKTFQVDFIADPANPSALTLANPYPIGQRAAAPPLNVVAVPPDRVEAYNIQWSASVERQLSNTASVEIAYVGSEASHLDNSRNRNDAPPALGPVQARRPYPLWGSIRWLGSDAKSYYESLQLRAERRFSHGLSFLASYTWSHNIDVSYGTNESLPFTPGGVQNVNCWGCERSNSGFDYTHRFTTSYLWNIPAPKDWKGVNRVCADWWFNTACFSSPPAFIFGNQSRLDPTLRGHGINNWDAVDAPAGDGETGG